MRTAIIACLVFASAARAGLTPESVAVVVNADSWASLSVANEYAKLRHIPDSNFIMVSGLSSFDFTDVQRFRSEILSPVLAELDARGLREQIDCITYSLDIPCAAAVNADMAGGKFHQVITPVASVNALTFLYESVIKKDATAYLDLDANRYARRTPPLALGARLTDQQRAEYLRGMTLYDAKKYAEAADAISSVVFPSTPDPDMLYNLACCQALAGRPEEAIATLRAAVTAGWRNHGQAASDPDFASINSRDEFKKLIEGMKAVEVRVQATRGFDASTGWSLSGEPDASGPRYVLSTFLGVASGRANSVNEVLSSLERAAGADATAPRGTVYFLKNADVRSTTRDWAFPSAQKSLGALGVACMTEDGVLPSSRQDVAGAVIGISDFDWASSKSKILPGAICEHLTSCGGMMGERDGQTPCTEFIRAGAAGTAGAVTEPYALQQKFPDAFIHAHYAAGCTLAESFYQSVRGPYQLLIIGDPLCTPWSKAGSVAISGVTKNTPAKDVVTIRASVRAGPAPIARYELFVDGRLAASKDEPEKDNRKMDAGPTVTARTGEFSLDTRAFADGEHTLSVVATHDDAIQTRSRGDLTVRVSNHDRAVKVVKKPQAKVTFGESFLLELECKGAERIDVMHLGRVVASIKGEAGGVYADSSRLSIGDAALRPIAYFAVAEGATRSGPAAFEVRGPVIRVAVTAPATGVGVGSMSGAKGLRFSSWPRVLKDPPPHHGSPDPGARPLNAASQTVVDTLDASWISRTGVKQGEAFELAGQFEASEADLYQVQLRTNIDAVIAIDGERIVFSSSGTPGPATGEVWRFAPVRLAGGVHTLAVRGVVPQAPKLDLRLGARGTRRPGEGWCAQP
jgi:hypothetical protein